MLVNSLTDLFFNKLPRRTPLAGASVTIIDLGTYLCAEADTKRGCCSRGWGVEGSGSALTTAAANYVTGPPPHRLLCTIARLPPHASLPPPPSSIFKFPGCLSHLLVTALQRSPIPLRSSLVWIGGQPVSLVQWWSLEQASPALGASLPVVGGRSKDRAWVRETACGAAQRRVWGLRPLGLTEADVFQ